jgi:hypothetical protein
VFGCGYIFLFLVLYVGSEYVVTLSTNQPLSKTNSASPANTIAKNLITSVQTDHTQYLTNSRMRIYGTIIDNMTGKGISQPVELTVGITNGTPDQRGVNYTYKATILSLNGSYSTYAFSPPKPGNYFVSIKVSNDNSNGWTGNQISVVRFWDSQLAYWPIVGGLALLAWIICTVVEMVWAHRKGKESQKRSDDLKRDQLHIHVKFEIARLMFISILTLAAVAIFAFIDTPITPNSPFSIITKQDYGGLSPVRNSTQPGLEWWINIGGLSTDNYKSGIQIPVSVIIFGVIGGYLRYLYNLSQRDHVEEDSKDDKYQVYYIKKVWQSLQDLLLYLLAPIVAMVAWLLLFELGTTSIFTLAAVSFTAGLTINEFINGFRTFAQGFAHKVGDTKKPSDGNSREQPNKDGITQQQSTVPSRDALGKQKY